MTELLGLYRLLVVQSFYLRGASGYSAYRD